NSTQTLLFKNREEAEDAVRDRNTGWRGLSNDKTIPKNDMERGAWVLRLFLAMKNRDAVLDKRPSRRWAPQSDYFYSEAHMERVCWDVVWIAEKLHLEGINIFPIYDPAMYAQLNKDMRLSFEARMKLLITMLCFSKAKCDAFMKGLGIEEAVICPNRKLLSVVGNRTANGKR
ncbi:hypothetical protein BDW02DRAFT_467212, partial [Decorospora gaudefroyi]